MSKTWGFYGRSVETAEIRKIISSGRWFFCAISGRRRIGKTTLIQRALEGAGREHFYVQIPDSDERGVVQTFREAFDDWCDVRLKDEKSLPAFINDFLDVSILIDHLNKDRGTIVSVDEFQYFHRVSLSPFNSFLQARIDGLRDQNKGGIFVLGSIHTEMTAILEDRNSPLFNRVTHRIDVSHWDFQTLFEMFLDHEIDDPHHQLFLWSLFEGIPKFYRDCFEQGALVPSPTYREDTLRRLFFEGSTPLRDEADNWFLRELRGRYDSVLKILARVGPCPHGDLKAEYASTGPGGEAQLGGYLKTLIERYRMVEKLEPIFSGNSSRKARYVITDNFLAAWLHGIARNVQMARVQPVALPVARASERLMVHEGFVFEKMIRLLTEECSRKGVDDFLLTELVRGYWNKADGSDIEIDLIALNDEDRIVRFGSCKRQASKHDAAALTAFEGHLSRFRTTKEGKRLSGWTEQRALYAPSFPPDQRQHLESLGYLCRDLPHFAAALATATPS